MRRGLAASALVFLGLSFAAPSWATETSTTPPAAPVETTTTTVPAPAPTTAAPEPTSTTAAATTTTSTNPPAPVVIAAPPTTVDPSLDLTGGGEGIDGMVPRPDTRGADAPTLLERFPPAAYEWDHDYGAPDVVALKPVGQSVADFFLVLLVTFGVIVTRVTSWVFTIPLVGTDLVEQFVEQVTDRVFLPYALGMLFGVGGYVVWLGFRSRVVEAVQHVVWCLTVLTIALGFAWAPGKIISATNSLTVQLSRATLAGAAVVTPNTGNGDGTTTVGTFTGDPADDAVRQATDVWWRLFVYLPWVTGELGDPNAVPGAGETILAFKTATPESLTPAEAKMIADPKGTVVYEGACSLKTGWDAVRCQRGQAFQNYRDKTLEPAPGVGSWVNGKHPWERVGIAVLALLAALFSGLIMLGISVAVVVWTYSGMFRLALLPLYALRGMMPERGQQVFVEYLTATAGTYLKRVGASIVLAVILVVYTAFAAAAASLGWAVLALSQVGASIAVIVLIAQHKHKTGGILPPAVHQGARLAGKLALQTYGGAVTGWAAGRVGAKRVARSMGTPGPRTAPPGPSAPGPSSGPRPTPGSAVVHDPDAPRRVVIRHAARVTPPAVGPARGNVIDVGERPAGALPPDRTRALPPGARAMPPKDRPMPPASGT